MTMNGAVLPILAMYVAAAEETGVDRKDLAGLRASRGHPKYTEGRRASRSCGEVKELVWMELCECGGLGQADDVRDLCRYVQARGKRQGVRW